MRTPADYLNAARERMGLSSDRKLDILLSVSGNVSHMWRAGKTLPKPANIAKLAELGGLDPQEALLDLMRWEAMKAKDSKVLGLVDELARRIHSTVKAAAFALVLLPGLLGAPGPARVEQNSAETSNIYYARWRLRRRPHWM